MDRSFDSWRKVSHKGGRSCFVPQSVPSFLLEIESLPIRPHMAKSFMSLLSMSRTVAGRGDLTGIRNSPRASKQISY
jgi:hypothetical protein